MTETLLQIAFYLLIAAMIPGFWRMARGPSVVDRIIAFDAVVMCAAGLVVLLSRLWQSPLYLDLILIISSLGFLGTVAFVFYLQKTLPKRRSGLAAKGEKS
jgi:multisubunit Na+/H+ antiporter MnhF subunit